jgi:hypothetical protein
VRLSSRVGQLPPGGSITVGVDDPPEDVVVTPCGAHSQDRGIPRFVVLAFTDAWGGGWIRVNGDLQRVPRESHFVPRLVHLRNPAMPWAGLLDEADWSAFFKAAGSPTDLPSQLEDLIPYNERQFPWLGERLRRERADQVLACTLTRRGRMDYDYPDRAVARTVDLATAFRKTQRFFKIATQSARGEVLYLTRG